MSYQMNSTIYCTNKRLANDMLLTHANPCAKAFQRIKISSNNLHVLIVSKEWSPVMPKYFKLS